LDRIIEFLKNNKVFYFASVDEDKPRVRPFGFFMEYEGKLYFGMGKHKASYRQVQVNPNVEICTANAKGEWIRIRGVAVFDERPEVMAKAFETLPDLTKIYNDQSGLTLANFYIKNGEAEIQDMQGHFEAFNF
jgi:uncharacterized pyridoxamine 5'-phosphate oxidase family protein